MPTFAAHLIWSGATNGATRDPATYSRDLEVSFDDLTLPLSAAPEYHGDPSRANPEQLFVAAISACQALTYLFLAARHGVEVMAYADDASGELQPAGGRMRITNVTLRPRIALASGSDADQARVLVEKAHASCFIANSVNAYIEIEPHISAADCRGEGQQHECGLPV